MAKTRFEKLLSENINELLLGITECPKSEDLNEYPPSLILFEPFFNILEMLSYFHGSRFSAQEKKLILRIQNIFPGDYVFNLNDVTDDAGKEAFRRINDLQILSMLSSYDAMNKTSFSELLKKLLLEFAHTIVNKLERQTNDQTEFLEFLEEQLSSVRDSTKTKNENQKINTDDIEKSLEKLQKLIGLGPVKKEIQSLINLIRVNQLRVKRGISGVSAFSHLVFTGNPGTGKTTVARLLGDIYASLGLLSSGHLVEIDRSGLIAGFVGQTAIKVNDVFKSAIGGVLFIDEAYSLCDANGMGYGQEAIDTLMKLIEDHRGEVLVIVAGYSQNMEEFLNSNPGMKSRFNKTIFFPDYSTNELLEILESLAIDSGFNLSDDAIEKSLSLFRENADENGALPGNARFVRNLFHEIVANQANRIVNQLNIDDDALQRIEASDICL